MSIFVVAPQGKQTHMGCLVYHVSQGKYYHVFKWWHIFMSPGWYMSTHTVAPVTGGIFREWSTCLSAGTPAGEWMPFMEMWTISHTDEYMVD